MDILLENIYNNITLPSSSKETNKNNTFLKMKCCKQLNDDVISMIHQEKSIEFRLSQIQNVMKIIKNGEDELIKFDKNNQMTLIMIINHLIKNVMKSLIKNKKKQQPLLFEKNKIHLMILQQLKIEFVNKTKKKIEYKKWLKLL